MIVNGGKDIKPTLILSVHDKNGKQIINNEINKCIKNTNKQGLNGLIKLININ